MALTTEPGRPEEVSTVDRRRLLVDALLDEMLSWNTREFIAAFRRWHHGSISLVHLNVLTMLETDAAASMSQLAAALDVSVASMTGIVDRMENRGLVERRRDGADRRVILVHSTDAGRNVFREIDRRRREGFEQLLGQLSGAELNGLLKGQRALRKARAAALASSMAVSPTTPSDLHGSSTNQPEDRPMKPGRRRPR